MQKQSTIGAVLLYGGRTVFAVLFPQASLVSGLPAACDANCHISLTKCKFCMECLAFVP